MFSKIIGLQRSVRWSGIYSTYAAALVMISASAAFASPVISSTISGTTSLVSIPIVVVFPSPGNPVENFSVSSASNLLLNNAVVDSSVALQEPAVNTFTFNIKPQANGPFSVEVLPGFLRKSGAKTLVSNEILFNYSMAGTLPPGVLAENFLGPWGLDAYGSPDDGVFRVNGDYCVGYGGKQCVELKKENAAITSAGQNLQLTVHANTYDGAEIQTIKGWTPGGGALPYGPSTYGYGYYETSMKTSCVPGQISSFFWIEAPGYGPHEWDIEFPDTASTQLVRYTIHPSGTSVAHNLGFNPCQGFHRYGFLWTPGQISYTVDGQVSQVLNSSDLTTTVTGFMMANMWTGNPNWGGGPPTSDAITTYQYIRYEPNLTAVPAW